MGFLVEINMICSVCLKSSLTTLAIGRVLVANAYIYQQKHDKPRVFHMILNRLQHNVTNRLKVSELNVQLVHEI